MVIRRIREHVTSHNWFAVAIDVAIVVVGVFLGTQVNNLNQKRIEGEQSASYRLRLIDELDFNARQYREQVNYYSQARAHGLAALAALDGRSHGPARDFLIDAYQTSQIDSSGAKTFIYDEMVSAGLVDRLGSEAIQETASDYYIALKANERGINEILPYRTMIREIVPYAMQEEIRTRCGDRSILYHGRIIGVRLVEPCPAKLDPAAAAKAKAVVIAEPRLRIELTRYLASLDEKLTLFDINRSMTTAFRDKLIAAARGA